MGTLAPEGRQVVKERVSKFPKAFRQYAVARLKQCDNIVEPLKSEGAIGGCCLRGTISWSRREKAKGLH